MALVGPDDVRDLIETALTDDQITAFIESAHSIIETRLQVSSCDMSEAELTKVELWLSAHFVAMRERQLSSTKLGDASDSFMGQAGMGLDFTQYGQTAKLMDRCGILANLGKARASLDLVS